MTATATTTPIAGTPQPSRTPYLEGSYAPVATEVTELDLKVTGEIPKDLVGTYVRNSANPRFAPKGRHHWFDGDGMLHAVTIENGRASYRNRWVRTKGFLAEEKAGEALWTGITERPDFTNPRGPMKDTSNTDLAFHAGKLLSLWWLGGEAYEIALPSLETKGTQRFGGKVRTMSAHPKVCPVTGEMLFFDYKPFPPYLTYGVIGASGELLHMTEIPLDGPRLQHDMAMTETHAILFDMSMMWDPELLMRGQTKVGFFRDKPMRIGVLPRRADGASIRWFETSAAFMYHTINAWNEGDEIVLVGCKIEEPLAGDPKNKPTSREVPTIGFLRLEPFLHEWRLNLTTGAVRERRLDDLLTEFPKMDPRRLGQKSRYSYNPRLADAPTLYFDALVKYDLETLAKTTHVFPEGSYGGEAAFAPRVGSTSEDDGYLLSFVVDERTGASELYVIDAKNVEAKPLARIAIPVRIPNGFHTAWCAP